MWIVAFAMVWLSSPGQARIRFVMTCEHDALRDEGIIYAMRLMAAGVPVELHNYPGTVHGFDLLTATDISARAINEGVEAFRRMMVS